MNLRLTKYLLIFLMVLLSGATQATTRRVLFIGNSFTYTNNMPLMLQTLATTLGDTLVYAASDPGGYTLQQHSTYAPTIAAIFSQPWDIVVLQEQSELPAFPPDQVNSQVYPYAHILDSMIHANDSCTQTMFLMTWGHADGDPPNCPSYPVICTYDGMQQRLRESYMQMTADNNAIVAPVGVAWKDVRDSFPALWMYMADSIHPIVAGSYLETCVLYNSIFHKRTYGCTYTDGLSTSDAQTLQRFADKVVFDSLSQWQQHGHYPDAGFSYTVTDNTVIFSDTSTSGVANSWVFGDGSNDTGTNPVHTYTSGGNYVVTHTSVTNCIAETMADTIHIATTGVSNTTAGDLYPISVVQKGNGNIQFMLPADQRYDALEVYDASGKLIRRYTPTARAITDNFIPGFYIYRAFSADGQVSCKGKLVVY